MPTADGSPPGSRTRSASAQSTIPGFASHPQHALAARQMSGFGGMVSPSRWAPANAPRTSSGRVRLFLLAESLGGVESLVSYPASMTHASVPPDRRAALGITEGLIRFPAASRTSRICSRTSSTPGKDSTPSASRQRTLTRRRASTPDCSVETATVAELVACSARSCRRLSHFSASPLSSILSRTPISRLCLCPPSPSRHLVTGVGTPRRPRSAQHAACDSRLRRVVRKVAGFFGERGLRHLFLANAVRVGPQSASQAQCPVRRR